MYMYMIHLLSQFLSQLLLCDLKPFVNLLHQFPLHLLLAWTSSDTRESVHVLHLYTSTCTLYVRTCTCVLTVCWWCVASDHDDACAHESLNIAD